MLKQLIVVIFKSNFWKSYLHT